MENPAVHLLSRVPWQFFVTLTWKSVKTERVQWCTLFAYLRTLGGWTGGHFHHLLWAARQERGEVNGREHFHLLVGGMPKRCICLSFIHASRNVWRKHGGGYSRVTPYVAGLGAVEYSFGGDVRDGDNLRIMRKGSVAGTAYENRKFGHASEVMTGRSVQALLARSVATEPRRLPQSGVMPRGEQGAFAGQRNAA